tara:strand:- start:2571 stop:2684 length:114 start_codon:yes stop_codon:yes gene_type:complete
MTFISYLAGNLETIAFTVAVSIILAAVAYPLMWRRFW